MKKVLIIVYSNFKNDNRVRKHKYFFEKKGYEVNIAGFEKDISWHIKIKDKLNYLFNLIFNKEKALYNYFSQLEMLEEKIDNEKKYDVVLANDWNTLYTGYQIAKKHNAKLIYDSHEFAIEEKPKSDIKWRIFVRPLIKYIEKKYIDFADLVITVSPDIQSKLEGLYKIAKSVTVMNIPLDKDIKYLFKKKKKTLNYPIQLFYSGRLNEDRGFDIVVEAVKNFSQKFELHMRLIGNVDYYRDKYNGDNIFIYGPVSPDNLVEETCKYDIGIGLIKPTNLNYVYSLPNKFFEYVKAGLPVITYMQNISMRKIIEKYDIGFVVENCDQKSIEKKLAQISIDDVTKIHQKLSFEEIFSAKKEWNKVFDYLFKKRV